MVCELKLKPLVFSRNLRNSASKILVNCEECDLKTSYVDMKMHMKVRHNKSKKPRGTLRIVSSVPPMIKGRNYITQTKMEILLQCR